ncbi:MAG TPA: hypothetical protein VNF69_16695 [Burkholderiales bacterium]|nr:hypothetical protein [Burkholderiales bacterium]
MSEITSGATDGPTADSRPVARRMADIKAKRRSFAGMRRFSGAGEMNYRQKAG